MSLNLTDLFPSSDPLDAPEFNLVEWVNKQFPTGELLLGQAYPTEQSLENLDGEIAKMKSTIKRMDEQIITEISQQSKAGAKGKEQLGQAQESIAVLFQKINEIKEKALEAERMVREITGDITELDTAKTNLTVTIRALTQINNIVTRLKQLKEMTQSRQYSEIAFSLESVLEMLKLFDEYKNVPKIKQLHQETENLMNILKNQIFDEFKGDFINSRKDDIKNLSSAARVLSVLGPDVMSQFIREFSKSQVAAYDMEFVMGSDSAKLEHAERRYSWLMNLLREYNRDYVQIFDPQWRIDEVLTDEICRRTREALVLLMGSMKDSLDPATLKRALKKTLLFEKELIKIFAAKAIPEEALKKKYNGIVSLAFDDFMYIHTQQQDRVMQDILIQALNEEKWRTDAKNNVLESAKILVFHFVKAREECLSISTGVGFFDLYQLFQKYLEKYGNTLKTKLNGLEAKSDESSLRIVCSILNTAGFCCSTAQDVEVGIKQSIDERFKHKVVLQSTIKLLMASCTDTMVSKVNSKLENAFVSLSEMDWASIEAVRDQSPFLTMIQSELNSLLPLFSEMIDKKHIGPLFYAMITMVIKTVDASVHKIRGISELGSEQLLCDIKMLKNFFSKITGDKEKWISKTIDQNISILENLCQILLSPPENIVSSYKKLFATPTPEQLVKFLDIKGIKKSEQEGFLDQYGVSKSDPIRQLIREAAQDEESTHRKIASFFDPKQYLGASTKH